jgi:hypothetical protein
MADIEEIYRRDWLKNFCQKNILIGEFKVLDNTLDFVDKAGNEINRKIEETSSNLKLGAKIKEKVIKELNKKLEELIKSKEKMIKLDLSVFEKSLDKAKKFNYLNQMGYDIIKIDLEYLRINL